MDAKVNILLNFENQVPFEWFLEFKQKWNSRHLANVNIDFVRFIFEHVHFRNHDLQSQRKDNILPN